MCRLARISKDTVNRLSHETASRVFHETLPSSSKPVQFLTSGENLRSVHGVAYTRLWNSVTLVCRSGIGHGFHAATERL